MPLIDDLRTICPPQNERELSHPDQLWRASGLHKCPRLQLLDAKGIHLQHPDWLLRKFSLHSGAHDNVAGWIQNRFSDTCEVTLEDTVYDPETRCGGHPDCILVEHGWQTAYVIEIKTYLQLPAGGVKDTSYWQHQISFYYHTLAEQHRWTFIIPYVFIATFGGQVRVIEPKVTEEYKDILGLLNLAWDGDVLPEYMYCYLQFDCKKCPISTVCTEPITSVNEFAEEVVRHANDCSN